MNVGKAIYGKLSADSTLTGLLATTTSIYPDVAPQGAANPCIVYSESTGDFTDNKDGVSPTDINIVQIDVYTQTVALRKQISDRVRTVLDRMTGTYNNIIIQGCKLIYSTSTIENYNDKTDTKIYRQSMDFQVRQNN